MRYTLKYLTGQKQIEITRSALFIKEISTLFPKLTSHTFNNCCRTLVNYLNNIIFILHIISSNHLKGTQHQLRNTLSDISSLYRGYHSSVSPPECIPPDSHVSSCLRNSPAARPYAEPPTPQKNLQGSFEDITDTGQHLTWLHNIETLSCLLKGR